MLQLEPLIYRAMSENGYDKLTKVYSQNAV